MIVVIADSIPPAVRGRMKLWFIEVKTNIFVSGVKDAVAREVVSYLIEACPYDSSMIILNSISKPPYYKVIKHGKNVETIKEISGLPLIFDIINDRKEPYI